MIFRGLMNNLIIIINSSKINPLLSLPSSSSRVSALDSALAPIMLQSTSSPKANGRSIGGCGERSEVLVQYVVLRRDLIDEWPLGSSIAQGCHAAVAAIWNHRDRPETAEYLSASNLDSMNKVTLEVMGEKQLRNLSEKLREEGIEHKLWTEQPENIPTCLATRPYPKSAIAAHFKKLKLCK